MLSVFERAHIRYDTTTVLCLDVGGGAGVIDAGVGQRNRSA